MLMPLSRLCLRLAVGSQESGSEAEIKSFCTGRYHVTFPMFSKVRCKGLRLTCPSITQPVV